MSPSHISLWVHARLESHKQKKITIIWIKETKFWIFEVSRILAAERLRPRDIMVKDWKVQNPQVVAVTFDWSCLWRRIKLNVFALNFSTGHRPATERLRSRDTANRCQSDNSQSTCHWVLWSQLSRKGTHTEKAFVVDWFRVIGVSFRKSNKYVCLMLNWAFKNQCSTDCA